METNWRAIGPSRKELSCALYRTAAGFELRCGYSVDDLMRSVHIGRQDNPRYVAAGWLHIVLSKVGFGVVDSRVDDELQQVRAAIQ